MRAIRKTNTKPELAVRRLLHRLGYRFRIHRRDLPGCPDVVLPRHRTVVFVNGCFWHQHLGCRYAKLPRTRPEYWLPKLARVVERDCESQAALEAAGWRVLIVWECECESAGHLEARLRRELHGPRPPSAAQP